MRLSPTLSETKFNLSLFLTTPAKKPRTECCCQSVAFMIAAMVVPLDWRSIPSTVSCFDNAWSLPAAFSGAAVLDAAADWVSRRFPDEALTVSGRLVLRFDALHFDLLAAIWFSLMSRTASRAATETSPTNKGGANRRIEARGTAASENAPPHTLCPEGKSSRS